MTNSQVRRALAEKVGGDDLATFIALCIRNEEEQVALSAVRGDDLLLHRGSGGRDMAYAIARRYLGSEHLT